MEESLLFLWQTSYKSFSSTDSAPLFLSTELRAARLSCLSSQQGRTRVSNHMYHEADNDRAEEEEKQHVWSLLVLCSNFWIVKKNSRDFIVLIFTFRKL